jgi:hypothetical protein
MELVSSTPHGWHNPGIPIREWATAIGLDHTALPAAIGTLYFLLFVVGLIIPCSANLETDFDFPTTNRWHSKAESPLPNTGRIHFMAIDRVSKISKSLLSRKTSEEFFLTLRLGVNVNVNE